MRRTDLFVAPPRITTISKNNINNKDDNEQKNKNQNTNTNENAPTDGPTDTTGLTLITTQVIYHGKQ